MCCASPFPERITKLQASSIKRRNTVHLPLTNPKLFFCHSMKPAQPCQTLQRSPFNAQMFSSWCYRSLVDRGEKVGHKGSEVLARAIRWQRCPKRAGRRSAWSTHVEMFHCGWGWDDQMLGLENRDTLATGTRRRFAEKCRFAMCWQLRN